LVTQIFSCSATIDYKLAFHQNATPNSVKM